MAQTTKSTTPKPVLTTAEKIAAAKAKATNIKTPAVVDPIVVLRKQTEANVKGIFANTLSQLEDVLGADFANAADQETAYKTLASINRAASSAAKTVRSLSDDALLALGQEPAVVDAESAE